MKHEKMDRVPQIHRYSERRKACWGQPCTLRNFNQAQMDNVQCPKSTVECEGTIHVLREDEQ